MGVFDVNGVRGNGPLQGIGFNSVGRTNENSMVTNTFNNDDGTLQNIPTNVKVMLQLAGGNQKLAQYLTDAYSGFSASRITGFIDNEGWNNTDLLD